MSLSMNIKPGSAEWLEILKSHIVSHEAGTVMQTEGAARADLIRAKASGEISKPGLHHENYDLTPERGAALQMIEDSTGDEFFPAVAQSEQHEYMVAAFHGVDMADCMVFIHYPYQKSLADIFNENSMPPAVFWRAEFELYVSGAEKAVIVTSNSTDFAMIEYESVPKRRNELIAGCETFANEVKAEKRRTLPALTCRLDGLTVVSNLSEFQAAASQLQQDCKLPIQNDADFDSRKKLINTLGNAEKRLDEAKATVLNGVTDVNKFINDVDKLKETLRQTRLATDRLIKAEIERIRGEIAAAGRAKFKAHIEEVQQGLSYPVVAAFDPDAAMKKKRTVDSMQKAVNEALEIAKTDTEKAANTGKANEKAIAESGYKSLFPDIASLVFNPPADVLDLIQTRVNAHKAEEARKAEQARQAEEARKAAEAEAARKAAEVEAARKAEEEARQAEKAAQPAEEAQPEGEAAPAVAASVAGVRVPVEAAEGETVELKAAPETATADIDVITDIGPDAITVIISKSWLHGVTDDFLYLCGDCLDESRQKNINDFLNNLKGQCQE